MSDHFGNIIISEGPKQKPKKKRPAKLVKPVKKKIAAKQKPPKVRKEIRWNRFFLISTLICATLLAIYAGIGFFLVPKLLQTSLTEKFQNSTGLKIAVGRTAFNPFSFRPGFKIFWSKNLNLEQTRFPCCRLIILTSTLMPPRFCEADSSAAS